jgi:hypothetical protein
MVLLTKNSVHDFFLVQPMEEGMNSFGLLNWRAEKQCCPPNHPSRVVTSLLFSPVLVLLIFFSLSEAI